MKIVTTYVAKDGTVFNNEEECRNYERFHSATVLGHVARVKRNRVVDKDGIHYPIKKIVVAAPYGTTSSKHMEYVMLLFDNDKGQCLNGLGIKKGTFLMADGFMHAIAFEREDGRKDCTLSMTNPRIEFLSPRNRRRA